MANHRVNGGNSSVMPSLGISEYQGQMPNDGIGRIYIQDNILYYRDKDGNSYRLQSSFKGWGYQTFAQGVISTPNIVITANENGYGASFDSTKILNNSAILVRDSNPESFAYNGTYRLFSTKIEVVSHSGTNVTLNNIPDPSWGALKVFYYYNYINGIPNGYSLAPKSLSVNLFNELDNLFVTEEEWDQRVDEIVSGVSGSSGSVPRLTPLNKGMSALATLNNGDKACSTAIASTPINDGYIQVYVNGLQKDIGITKDCYFGVSDSQTERTLDNVQSGDTLRWNGSIAKYQLDVLDKIDFTYVTY